MQAEKWVVYALLVLKAFIYGLSVLWIGKLLQSIGVMDVLALRFLLSALGILVLVRLGVIKLRFQRKSMKLLLLVSIFEPIGYFLFETLGIQRTSTVTAGIILALMPLSALVTESLILRERTTLLQKLFLCLGIVGAVVIVLLNSTQGGSSEWMGILFLLLAVISGSLFLAFSRKASASFSSMEITAFMSFASAIVFNAINLFKHAIQGDLHRYFVPLGDFGILSGLLFLAWICSLAATAINNYACSKIQISSVSALGGLTMVVTVLAGVMVNQDRFTLAHLIGTVLILAGSVGVNVFGGNFSRKQGSGMQTGMEHHGN
ncbi:DMT family transporter [Paenibacillus hodogayensis]|uniref:DMT family transporter n=1 Tax=Paenibacillus hodogayensis TaxID=279208 RepID=A0ABV5VQA5_9BACL